MLSRVVTARDIDSLRIWARETAAAVDGWLTDREGERLFDRGDQVFVAAFVRCHGSIKQMEQFFGVSYPTIKNRLNRIGAELPFAEVEVATGARASASDLISRLERGEMTAAEVIAELARGKDER